ncbi:armadillo-type protein [Pelagophyceae sp. CCMP2097]|nr:armadillo-type protein [Pelagophyceae sp. CCMP2097]
MAHPNVSIESVLAALNVEYGAAGAPAHHRAEARGILQAVQASTDLAYNCAAAILETQHPAPPAAQLFALACLETLATTKWNDLRDEHKLAVRGAALGAARRTHAEEPSFVRNKKAALLSHVALREFPQNWPNFVDDLLSPNEAGGDRDTFLELGFLCVAELAEDCTDADYNARLPAKRRTDVLKALNVSAPLIVRELFGFAERTYAQRQTAGAVATRRLCCGLRCLKTLATWVSWDSEPMAPYDPIEFSAFLATNGHLPLDDDDVSLYALGALRALASSAHLNQAAALKTARALPRICEVLYMKGCADFADLNRRDHRAALWSALARCVAEVFRELTTRFKALGVLDYFNAEAARSRAESSLEDDDYDGVEEDPATPSKAATKAALLSHDGQNELVDEACAAYLHAALSVLRASPSKKAAEALLPLWRDAARLASTRRLGKRCVAAAKEVLTHIVALYAERVCKHAVCDDVDVVVDNLFEFVDDDEYDGHFATMRAGVSQLIGALVDLDVVAVATATDARLRQLLEEAQQLAAASAAMNAAQHRGLVELQNTRLEGVALIVERVCDETLRWRDEKRLAQSRKASGASAASTLATLAPNPNPRADEAIRILDDSTLRAVIAWTPAPGVLHSAQAKRKLSLYEATRSILQSRPARLHQVLRELFAFLAYEDGDAATQAGVRRKSAWTLLRLAESAPEALATQFDELRDGASRVIGSKLLCELASQHLCEALVLASNACSDDAKRRELLEAVLRGPLGTLELADRNGTFATPRGFLLALGVLRSTGNDDATRVATLAEARSLDDSAHAPAEQLRRAFGAILGVARRAARSAVGSGDSNPEYASTDDDEMLCAAPSVPPPLAQLAAGDAAAAVLARALPAAIAAIRCLHALWAPPTRDLLRCDAVARLVLAPSLDEIRSKVDPASFRHARKGMPTPSSANVSTTASSTGSLAECETATDGDGPPARDSNGAKWAMILNELRSSVYQIARLWIERRCAFAPDALQLTGALLKALGVVDSEEVFLETMEHRHVASLLKHVLEPLALRCPPQLHHSHLDDASLQPAAGADEAFYRSSGVAMQDWGAADCAVVVDVTRRELTRAYLDCLQVIFAVKGELAAPVALALKAADKRSVRGAGGAEAPAAPVAVPKKAPGVTDGERGLRVQRARERRAAHVASLRRCVVPLKAAAGAQPADDLSAAFALVRTLARGVRFWSDIPTCRFATKLAQTVVEDCFSDDRYAQLLASLFDAAVEALVLEPPWRSGAGCEFELLALARGVYLALVIGGDPSACSKKPAIQQPRHDGPRQSLLRLPGVEAQHVHALEAALREPASTKEHKNALHDIVVVALVAKEKLNPQNTQSVAGSMTASVDASALREQTSTVLNLPGEMISSRKLAAHQRAHLREASAPANLADLFR